MSPKENGIVTVVIIIIVVVFVVVVVVVVIIIINTQARGMCSIDSRRVFKGIPYSWRIQPGSPKYCPS